MLITSMDVQKLVGSSSSFFVDTVPVSETMKASHPAVAQQSLRIGVPQQASRSDSVAGLCENLTMPHAHGGLAGEQVL